MVHVDRWLFLASLGGVAAVKMMSSEAKAEALESKEGLGNGSPVAHMWRIIAMPDNPL